MRLEPRKACQVVAVAHAMTEGVLVVEQVCPAEEAPIPASASQGAVEELP